MGLRANFLYLEMLIHQIFNPNLSHFSYIILEESSLEIVLIDPSRNLAPYLDWVQMHKGQISHIIETHSHADFVSSHLEIHQRTNAQIHVSNKFEASFPFNPFDTNDFFEVGSLKFRAINTPGHSLDSICIVLSDAEIDHCIFTGDTLLIGDCGRPDLRDNTGTIQESRESLAKQMFHSLRENLAELKDELILFPAHGAGSLCGKSLSDSKSSTLGAERRGNWALKEMKEKEFVETLIQDQPFAPQYFSYDVALNQKGAPVMELMLQNIPYLNQNKEGYFMEKDIIIIDTRPQNIFNGGHYPKSINLTKSLSFSTWLGSLIKPEEPFYLLAELENDLDDYLIQIADIGYEGFMKAMITMEGSPFDKPTEKVTDELNLIHFRDFPQEYTIVDIRNYSEVKFLSIFPSAINIPLPELRDRVHEISTDKPVVVHCAGGYRSAAGSSLIRMSIKTSFPIYDLGVHIQEFSDLN